MAVRDGTSRRWERRFPLSRCKQPVSFVWLFREGLWLPAGVANGGDERTVRMAAYQQGTHRLFTFPNTGSFPLQIQAILYSPQVGFRFRMFTEPIGENLASVLHRGVAAVAEVGTDGAQRCRCLCAAQGHRHLPCPVDFCLTRFPSNGRQRQPVFPGGRFCDCRERQLVRGRSCRREIRLQELGCQRGSMLQYGCGFQSHQRCKQFPRAGRQDLCQTVDPCGCRR